MVLDFQRLISVEGCPGDAEACMPAGSASTLSPPVTSEFSGGKAIRIGSDELEPGSQEQRRELIFPVTFNWMLSSSRMGRHCSCRWASLTANIKLRKVSYMKLLLLGELQGKAESLQRL